MAHEKESGETFLLKMFYKSDADCNNNPDLLDSRGDCVRELIAGTMYQLLMHDQAPIVQLVIPDSSDKEVLYVRYKYFGHASDIERYYSSAIYGQTPKNTGGKVLGDIQGIEKVLAASHILGENDLNFENIIVVPEGDITFRDVERTDKNTGEKIVNKILVKSESCRAIKIDHGRSFLKSHESYESIKNSFQYRAYELGLKVNIEKYSYFLNQMLNDLNEQQIDSIIEQKIDLLKNAGFNPAGILSKEELEVQKRNHGVVGEINEFDSLKSHYRDFLQQNIESIKKIAKQIEVIAKLDIDNGLITQEFKDGAWIKILKVKDMNNPIQYAIDNKLQIDGMDAAIYKQKIESDSNRSESRTARLKNLIQDASIVPLPEKRGASDRTTTPRTVRPKDKSR